MYLLFCLAGNSIYADIYIVQVGKNQHQKFYYFWKIIPLAKAVVVLCAADEQDKRSLKPSTPARQLYHEVSEVRAVLQKHTGGFGVQHLSFDEKVQKATTQLIKAMNQLLKEHQYLPAKKRLYIEFGCRGDWPELKPQDWNPVLEGLDRKPITTE